MFSKYGGNLGETNSVAWMFDRKSLVRVAKDKIGEDALLAAALEAGADDLKDADDVWEITSPFEAHQTILDAVAALGIEPDSAEIAMLPQNLVKLEGKPAQQMLKLMDLLDDHDDTKNVWSNFDVEEQEIEASLA
jgi:transcriptional/translational regulatory protein YebC/TACO1